MAVYKLLLGLESPSLTRLGCIDLIFGPTLWISDLQLIDAAKLHVRPTFAILVDHDLGVLLLPGLTIAGILLQTLHGSHTLGGLGRVCSLAAGGTGTCNAELISSEIIYTHFIDAMELLRHLI